MIIEKVILKNFRNHSESEFKFTNGINLIIGKNGTGKSSILDAIGYALFNNKGRTSSIKDAIREGEKYAKVTVCFRPDDGTSYTVERNLSTGESAFYQNENPGLKIKLQNEVQTKLRELLGVRLESDSIFSSIILGSQNKITDLFTGTPQDKLKRFDNLFSTQIYRQISEGYLKKSEDKYASEIKQREFYLVEIAGLLINPEILEQQFLEFNNIKIELEIKKNFASEILTNHRNELESLNLLKLDIEKSRTSINHNKQRLNDFESQNNILLDNLKVANESKKILADNEYKYNQYLIFTNDYDTVNSKIDTLEKLLKQTEKLNKEIFQIQNESEKIKSESTEKQLRLLELDNEITEIKNAILLKEQIISELNPNVNLINDKINILNKILNSVSIEINGLDKSIQQINNIKIEINSLEDSLVDESLTEDNIKSLENKIIESQSKIVLRNDLNKEIEALKHRFNDNKSAHQELSNGICPFLTEDCLNIKKGTSINIFFNERATQLSNKIEELNIAISNFAGIDSEFSELNNNKIILNESLKSNDLCRKKIELKTIEIDKINSDNEIRNLKLSLILSENKEILKDFELEDKSNILNLLNTTISDYKFQLKEIQTNINQTNKDIKTINEEISKKNENVNQISNRIAEIKVTLDVNDLKISNINSKVEINEEQISPIEDFRIKRDEIKIVLFELEEPYQLYLKNVDLPKRIPEIELSLSELKLQSTQVSEILILESQKLEILESSYNDELYNNVKSLVNNAIDELKKIETEIQKNEIELNLHKDRIHNNNINIQRKKEIESENLIFNNKLKLTSILRTNLKTMGQVIANKLLEKIQIISTENFRLISGRMESIIWKSDINTNEMYQVYLRNQKTDRAFELLSGGEQMMVALSIRAAMNNLLTNSKFVIFDEPTVNLDSEKRAALSESLNHILKSLDQAIIVTHDNTFMEMAQNIIEL